MNVNKPSYFKKNFNFETLIYAAVFDRKEIKNNHLTNHFILTDYVISRNSKLKNNENITIDQLEELKYFPNIKNSSSEFEKWISYNLRFCLLVESFDYILLNKDDFIWKCQIEHLEENFVEELSKIEKFLNQNIELITIVRKKIGNQ